MFKPIKNKRLSDLVTDEIKEIILSRELKPGGKLPSERELSLQMKVGRPVIRESLRYLELSGLIHIKQGIDGGIFVKEPEANYMMRPFSDLLRLGYINIEELTEARLLIEMDVLELVMKKVQVEGFKLLDEIISLGFEKIKRKESIRMENLNFHILLAELSRNPIFIMIINSMMAIISVFIKEMNPSRAHSKRILESHKDILEEMKTGNIEAAREKLKEHILFFNIEYDQLGPLKGIKFDQAMPVDWRKLWIQR